MCRGIIIITIGVLATAAATRSAPDPETPLAMPYFLDESQLAADLTPAAATKKSDPVRYTVQHPNGVQHSVTEDTELTPMNGTLMETKTRHSSTMFDLHVAPTYYDEEDDEDDEEERRNAGRQEVADDHPGVTTKVIYPGAGKWAQRGLKHKPYIRPNLPYYEQYNTPSLPPKKLNVHENVNVDIYHRQKNNLQHRFPLPAIKRPTQHLVLKKAPPKVIKLKYPLQLKRPQQVHHLQQAKYAQQVKALQQYPLYPPLSQYPPIAQYPPITKPKALQPLQLPVEVLKLKEPPKQKQITPVKEDQEDEDDKEDDFVPTRMYAQVRQYEHETHLPASLSEPRLRKTIKDSRIHTVYKEEGYEDGAYDHAGEEKHAEEDEAREEHVRRRRAIDPFASVIHIDTDFIGKTRYLLGQPPVNTKYPYYNHPDPDLHLNSPLRYAQDLNDIPHKQEGNMAFYDDAAARVRCEEVAREVNPIPPELDSGGEEAPVKPNLPPVPRLEKLGDKIDCFKARYFGEDPFDSPIFKEKSVGGSPRALFAELRRKEIEGKLSDGNRLGKSLQAIVEEDSEDAASVNEQMTSEEVTSSPSTTTTTMTPVMEDEGFQPMPEAEALRMRRVTRRRQRPPYHPNKLHTNRYGYRGKPVHRTTPPPPAQNTISEVYYKDQIKPSEQLNVFADVINHIQNMSREDTYATATEQKAHVAPQQQGGNRPGGSRGKGQRKKGKRKYPVMKSTQQLYNDYMRRSKKNPARMQTENLNFVPQDTSVGTVQFPSAVQPHKTELLGYAFKEHPDGSIYYSTIDLPMNKFLVPGMKPPLPDEKPLIYSDFQNSNILKRRDWLTNHRLIRRRRATRNYSEIRRQPARRPSPKDEEESDDDADDYVPHRHKTYHYDPETDRIVYDKKPVQPTEPSVEDMIDGYFEEMEAEGEQEEVTTKKPAPTQPPHRTVYHKDVLNKTNGDTLVDFLAKLKSDPAYKPIMDPEPTKEPPTTTTLKPVSTTPPEFLKFLEKLHKSDGYKHIEDEDPKAKKKATTTEAPAEEEQEEVVEEPEEEQVQVGKVQNSPGGQFGSDASQLQIFDITDYLPKVKSYTPRTSIDYSRYKTIERAPPPRHNLSSRYSEDEEETPNPSPSTDAPIVSRYQTVPPRQRQPTQEVDDDEEEAQVEPLEDTNAKAEKMIATTTTTTTTTTTSSPPKIRVRQRQRSTRRPTRTTTTRATTSEPTTDEEVTEEPAVVYTPATHRPVSRIYPRRHRPKIRLRAPTTTPNADDTEDNDEEPSEDHRRTVRRRGPTIPTNHKPDYTPVTISRRMDDDPIALVQRQPRLVTPDIISYNRTAPTSVDNHPGSINPRRVAFRRKDDYSREKPQVGHTGNTLSNVKFIRDPSKRPYYYAPL